MGTWTGGDGTYYVALPEPVCRSVDYHWLLGFIIYLGFVHLSLICSLSLELLCLMYSLGLMNCSFMSHMSQLSLVGSLRVVGPVGIIWIC